MDLVYLSFRPKRSHKTSLPRSTNTKCVCARKRPCTFRISPYTTVLCRITWFRIRIVSLRGRIRSNTTIYGEKWRAYTAFVYEGSKGAFFFCKSLYSSVYNTEIYDPNTGLCKSS